jgi:hypothetical protein
VHLQTGIHTLGLHSTSATKERLYQTKQKQQTLKKKPWHTLRKRSLFFAQHFFRFCLIIYSFVSCFTVLACALFICTRIFLEDIETIQKS